MEDCRLCLRRVREFYGELTAQSLADMGEVYAADAVFADPAGEVRGLAAIKAHFARLLEGATVCRFSFSREFADGDSAVLCWRMTIAAKRLNGGREFFVDGVSVLRFADGLAIRHRDYFDLGALLYERLPLLGAIIRRLRRRLAARE